MSDHVAHQERVKKIQEQVSARPPDQQLRVYHGSSNSTRQQNFAGYHVINTSNLTNIIEINQTENYILVEPSVQMDQLVAETLKYKLLPPVVPEFPGISIGGAVQGGAGESSSFKFSGFHHNAIEYEIVLGDGSIVTASPSQNADLFWGTSCSYGTLGILTAIKLKLIPAAPFVRLKYHTYSELPSALTAFDDIMKHPDTLDFVDAIMYSPSEIVIMTGNFADEADGTLVSFLGKNDEWFYLHARKRARARDQSVDYIPIQDFLFRYDRGAFWVGRLAFKRLRLPFTKHTRRLLDSVMHTRILYKGVQKTDASQRYFAQDIYMPKDSVPQFVDYISKRLGIWPLWLLPMKKHNQPLDIFGLPQEKADYVINVGVWGDTRAKNFEEFRTINREVEAEATKQGAHKTLYAHSYYTESEFWAIYDKPQYQKLRAKYHAHEAFADIYQKVTVTQAYNTPLSRALLLVIGKRLRSKLRM